MTGPDSGSVSDRTPGPVFIPRDTDEKPSDAMPSADFADWREQAEWWRRTCIYWRKKALSREVPS